MKYLLLLSLLFFVSAATCEKKVAAEDSQTVEEPDVPYVEAEEDSGHLNDVQEEVDEVPVDHNDEPEAVTDEGEADDEPET